MSAYSRKQKVVSHLISTCLGKIPIHNNRLSNMLSNNMPIRMVMLLLVITTTAPMHSSRAIHIHIMQAAPILASIPLPFHHLHHRDLKLFIAQRATKRANLQRLCERILSLM